jgi:hypothetical protein
MYPLSSDDLYVVKIGSMTSTTSNTVYIRYDTMSELSPLEFTRYFGKFINFDYKKEEAKAWQKILVTIVVIVIIVVSAILLQPEGGLLAAGIEGAIIFAGQLGLVIAFTALGLSLLSKYFMSRGQYGTAFLLNGTVQILGGLSTFLSIISIIGAWYTGITKAITEVAIKVTTQGIWESLKTTVIEFAKQSTSKVITQVTGWLSKGFYIYSNYIDPPTDNSDLKKEVDKQNKKAEDYATPDMLKKVQWLFESPHANIYDMNEYMQNIPYLMTQGRIDNATTKYYS